MSRTTTLTDLLRRVREKADMEGDATYIDDTELTGYINDSLGKWHQMVSMADPERFGATQSITADGSTGYALPDDFLATLRVEYDGTGTDEPYSLVRYSINEKDFFSSTTNNTALGYRFWGSNLVLMPAPSSGSYTHYYVTHAPILSSGSDTVDGVNGWDAWIVYDAAIQCRIKEEDDASQLKDEREKVEKRIAAAAQSRDFAQADRVADTRTRHKHGPRRGRYWYSLPEGFRW